MQHTVCAKQTIDDYFNYLDVDDNKSSVDDKVEKRSHWSAPHFGLPHGNTRHNLPSFRFSVIDHQGPAQVDILHDFTDFLREEIHTG